MGKQDHSNRQPKRLIFGWTCRDQTCPQSSLFQGITSWTVELKQNIYDGLTVYAPFEEAFHTIESTSARKSRGILQVPHSLGDS